MISATCCSRHDPATKRLPLLLLLLAGAGCGSAAQEQAAEKSPRQTAPRPVRQQAERDLSAPSDRVWETWDICFIGDAKVGYAHQWMAPLEDRGQSLLRLHSQQQLTLQREGDLAIQELTLDSIETAEGQLVRFESKMTAGSQDIVTRGRFQDGQLVLQLETAGKTQSRNLDWDRRWGGFFAIEQTLRRQPMTPGEKRTIQALMPALNILGQIHLQAADYEVTEMRVGHQRLLRINCTIDIGARLDIVFWVDAQGETRKSWDRRLNLLCYRTTQDVALAKFEGDRFDLNRMVHVPVRQPLVDPHATRQVSYRAELADADPAQVFPQGSTQSVTSIDPHTAAIVVTSIRPDDPGSRQPDPASRPTAADLAANNLIQSDDPSIIAMAEEAVPEDWEPWKTACELERYVNRTIQNKDFTQSFATAAEVAQSRQGDCTEHAVLLAALCRARKIPTRVASGLVYYQQGFAYHMWNEVWIQDRWVPIDATLGRGGIGAAHLKLAASNLQGVSPFSAMLPVLQVLGRLKLEIVKVQ